MFQDFKFRDIFFNITYYSLSFIGNINLQYKFNNHLTMDSISSDNEILYCSFNQDQSNFLMFPLEIINSIGCFAIGTQTGFKIFQANPFKESFFRGMNFRFL